MYVSTYGELDVVLDRNMEAGTMLLVDFNYTAAVLRPTADWPIAKMGDSDKRQILWEGHLPSSIPKPTLLSLALI